MWNRRTNQSLPDSPVQYPPGTFLKTPKGYWYIHDEDKRLRIISKRVLDSWTPSRVVVTSDTSLANYRIYSKMKFRNGSLIYSLGDGRVYLIVGGKRCPIVSPDVFERIGATDEFDAVSVSEDEANLHPLGEALK